MKKLITTFFLTTLFSETALAMNRRATTDEYRQDAILFSRLSRTDVKEKRKKRKEKIRNNAIQRQNEKEQRTLEEQKICPYSDSCVLW